MERTIDSRLKNEQERHSNEPKSKDLARRVRPPEQEEPTREDDPPNHHCGESHFWRGDSTVFVEVGREDERRVGEVDGGSDEGACEDGEEGQ